MERTRQWSLNVTHTELLYCLHSRNTKYHAIYHESQNADKSNGKVFGILISLSILSAAISTIIKYQPLDLVK